MNKLLTFSVAIIMFSSCSITQKTTSSDFDFIKITKQGIIQKPLVADLDVSKEKKSLTRTYASASVEWSKNQIMGEYLQEYKCDLIVHPIFSSNTTTRNERTSQTITVNGYPAMYKNIRNFELKDTSNFIPKSVTLLNTNESYSKSVQSVENIQKKGKGVVTLVVAGVLLVTALLTAVL